MHIAGLDIGTTGCKIVVFDAEGHFCGRFYRDYPVMRSHGEHGIDASAIWSGVKTVLAEEAEAYPDIAGIGVTSFGEACVFLDETDLPLDEIMLYTDSRGSKECEWLTEKLGAMRIAEITGLAPHSMYSICKVMWVKRNRPEMYAKARHILLMEDYVIYLLTGEKRIDYSLATRSMAFDIRNFVWSKEIFEAADVDSGLFSVPVPSGTVAGSMKEGLSRELGFAKPPVLLPVGHDQVAAAIGTGVFKAGIGAEGAGTVECITPIYDSLPSMEQMQAGNYAVVPYVVPGKYVTYAFSYTGGALVDWFVKNLAKGEKCQAAEQGKSVYELLEADMKDEPSGILVLPHFAGAATPYMDTGSKGTFIGLTLEHTVSDLYRAVMEGVAYEMMLNLQQLRSLGIMPQKLYAVGGGASSKVWMQIKADMWNIPIVTLENAEAGSCGCAMLAGIAVGCFRDLEEAAAKMIVEKDSYYPRAEKHVIYLEYFQKYEKLYEAVRGLV